MHAFQSQGAEATLRAEHRQHLHTRLRELRRPFRIRVAHFRAHEEGA